MAESKITKSSLIKQETLRASQVSPITQEVLLPKPVRRTPKGAINSLEATNESSPLDHFESRVDFKEKDFAPAMEAIKQTPTAEKSEADTASTKEQQAINFPFMPPGAAASQKEAIDTMDTASVGTELLRLKSQLNGYIVGQEALVRCLIIALIAEGHVLVEGAPGLAKTTAIKTLAQSIRCDFHRIQFTPDLLPADIIGSDIYRPQTGAFEFYRGSIFNQIILADEINRAPAKVQSALLEAMEERQVSVGQKTYSLPEIFMVMATQNPIEQEGTYALPEAQLDRFLFKVNIGYPNTSIEKKILNLQLVREQKSGTATLGAAMDSFVPISQETILQARRKLIDIHLSEGIKEYIVQLVIATRQSENYDPELKSLIAYGASPRGTIALSLAARGHALLSARDFVKPEDVHQVLFETLRHRIILSFEAQAQRITSDEIIQRLLELVPIF